MPLGPAPDRRLDPEDDLAWLAFRYVAAAMSPGEADQFEARLLDDQNARLAVAAAVDQFGALAIVAREVAGRPDPWSTRRRVWRRGAILALAAGVVLAAGWGIERVVRPATGDVALAWATLRGEGGPGDDPTPPVAEPAPSDPGGADPVVAEVPAERPVPSWMVAAVAPPPADEPASPEGE